MYKITFHSDTNLSTITNKPTKVDFIKKPKIKKYVNKHYPNARKFEIGSDYIIIYNPTVITISLDVVING